MKLINILLGIPLGYIIYFAYQLTKSYGIAILLFTLFIKLIMFPINLHTHKNSIRLLQLQPALQDINRRYDGEKERLGEAQLDLYKRERYSPFVGLVPLFIQLILVIGVLQVMYNPLQHMLHLDSSVIELLLQATRELYGTGSVFGEQLQVIEALHQADNLPFYEATLVSVQNGADILQQIAQTDLNFLGINLGEVPSFASKSLILAVPFLSGISALAFCLIQNTISPGTFTQGAGSKWGLTIFTVAFSLYFTFVVPAGVGIYWIVSNILSIVVAFVLNALYDPKIMAKEALPPKKTKASYEEKQTQKQQKKDLYQRQKFDMKRFVQAKKQLVFFAISSGQFKYFETIIQYLLSHSNHTIHYLTTDPNDAVFTRGSDRLIPYYTGESKAVGLMMRLEADMVAMTVPDLQNFHIKRSIAKTNIEYVYIFHSMTSVHMVLRQGALDHFDTVFCVGPHQADEIRRTEQVYALPQKRLVKAGSSIADILLQRAKTLPQKQPGGIPQLLIAPSWQADCILDTCIDSVLEQLVGNRYRVIVRPHPEYIKRFPDKMQAILNRWQNKVTEGLLFELDYARNDSIYQSDLVLTDWSTIALEFSYCTKRPSLFINTPMKVMNPDYQRICLEPSDISLRTILGQDLDPEELDGLSECVEQLLSHEAEYQARIESFMETHLYYPGRSGEAGGRYIMNRLHSDE